MIDSFRGKYKFLSNFFEAGVVFNGIAYPTVEHGFQAAKTNNIELRMLISRAKTPGKAKELGNCVRLRDDWEDVKIGIMKRLVNTKFMRKDLEELLLDTGNEELVEGNNWGDTFWGVCNGKGRNELGKILMELREELRKDE